TMLLQSQGITTAQTHPLTHMAFDPRLPTTATEWKAAFGFEFENLGKRSVLLGRLATDEILADPVGYAKLTAFKQPRMYVGVGTQSLYTMSFADPTVAQSAVQDPKWLWRSGWWGYQFAAEFLLFLGYFLSAVGIWTGVRDPRLRTATLVC